MGLQIMIQIMQKGLDSELPNRVGYSNATLLPLHPSGVGSAKQPLRVSLNLKSS